MASALSKQSENEVAEALDARVFNLPSEPQESTPASAPGPATSQAPSSPGKITLDPDPQESGQPVPPPVHNKPNQFSLPLDPESKNSPQVTPQPQIPVVPHLPSKYAPTYELEKFNENRMIIFNHDEFLNGPPRPGTLKDEESLRKTFAKFRFTIDPTYRNCNKKQIIDAVRHFAVMTNFSRYGCICVVIMTHGYTRKPGYLLANDIPYNEHEIFEHFNALNNNSLAAKPIIFIIQACRGAEPSPRIAAKEYRLYTPQLDDGEEKEFYHLPMDANRVVFHSSYIGRASVRHPLRGSWFIQTLCKKINQFAWTHDLETIFRMVRSEVALDCVTIKDWKQMPVVSSTTIREIYFAANLPLQTDSKDMVDLPVQLSSSLNLSSEPEETTREPTSVRMNDENPDAAMAQIRLLYMPCSCFLEYYEYLKRCLRSFVQHNAEDGVAANLLTMVERAGDGAEYNLHKFSLITSVWEHFEANLYRFPPDGSAFVYRLFH